MTPGLFHRRQHGRERELDLAVELLHVALADALEERLGEARGGGGVADERVGLLLGGRVGLQLEAVLARELVQRVLGARRLDEVREEQRVLLSGDPMRLGVVDEERPVEALRPRGHDHFRRAGQRNSLRIPCKRHHFRAL